MPESLPLGFATVDLDRQRRQGLPEVIYAPGKQPGEIAAIAAALLDRASGPVLVTRLGPEAAAEVAASSPRPAGSGPARAGLARTGPGTTSPEPGCCIGGQPRRTEAGWPW